MTDEKDEKDEVADKRPEPLTIPIRLIARGEGFVKRKDGTIIPFTFEGTNDGTGS